MEGRNPKRAQGTRGVGADHPWCSRPSLENPGTPCAANFASYKILQNINQFQIVAIEHCNFCLFFLEKSLFLEQIW